jgi:trans-2,3-dihydro-3-hydroxyanthranilate isomerase
MTKKQFSVYNSFTDTAYAGNPAGVIPDADDLSTEQMQAIARQLNLVESVFILKSDDPQSFCKLRYFMPEKELPITGHPTVAAWSFMRDKGLLPQNTQDFLQETAAGVIAIKVENDTVFCSQSPPTTKILEDAVSKDILDVLHLTAADIDASKPFAVVNTGLGHLIFAVNSLASLMKMRFVPEQLQKLCNQVGAREAQIYCTETYDPQNTAHTRNLCPRYGLEDPACGNGSAALGCYYFQFVDGATESAIYRFEQGNVVKSPSLVNVLVEKGETDLQVMVGGHAFHMIDGEIVT